MNESVTASEAGRVDVERWLSTVVSKRKSSLKSIVDSMIADGFDEGTACAMAGVAWIRHRPEPLESLLRADSGMDLVEAMVRAARLMPPAAAVDVSATLALLDPLALTETNEIAIDGHNVAVRFLCDKPRIALFDNVVTAAECEALIALARARLTPSELMSDDGPASQIDSTIRSSSTCTLLAGDGAVVEAIERRVSQLLQWPASRMEFLTITHYPQHAQYKPHRDYFDRRLLGHRQHLERGGQRLATLILYLNDVEAGGATVFPQLGLELRARRGAAAYFLSHEPDGRLNPANLHAGAPVDAAEKWIATVWLREDEYPERSPSSGATEPEQPAPGSISAGGPTPADRAPLFSSPGLAVIDDLMSSHDWRALTTHLNREKYWSVHANGHRDVWRLTDGTPLTGKHGFYHCTGRRTPDALNFPTGTPYDALIDAMVRLLPSLESVVGKGGVDWQRLSFAPWLYPSGTALSLHRDDGRYTGAFVFYAHASWNAHWGGHLLVLDARTKAGGPGGPEGELWPPFISDQGESERVFDPGLALTVFSRPNRIVFMSREAQHMVTRVDANAGHTPRVSVAGFFHRD